MMIQETIRRLEEALESKVDHLGIVNIDAADLRIVLHQYDQTNLNCLALQKVLTQLRQEIVNENAPEAVARIHLEILDENADLRSQIARRMSCE